MVIIIETQIIGAPLQLSMSEKFHFGDSLSAHEIKSVLNQT